MLTPKTKSDLTAHTQVPTKAKKASAVDASDLNTPEVVKKLQEIAEQIDTLEEEIRERREHIRDIYKAARDDGFDVAALKAATKNANKPLEAVQTRLTLEELYLRAIQHTPEASEV